MHDLARVRTHFRYWGQVEARANLSPLYEVFGYAVAEDDAVLALAAECREGQPPPNVLFAAVHALLRHYPDHPLRAYCASLGGSKPADDAAGWLLREFCLTHREELLPVIHTRLTQTNEVRRCGVLLPAFAQVAGETGQPLALIEIGPSAGLNLLFDRYQYHYGDLRVGDPASPVALDCEPRGELGSLAIPAVVSRTGIDINPLDVRNEADVEWLRALLWPEHLDRLQLLDAALDVAREDPPVLHRGDVIELLPDVVRAATEGSTVCLFATFVLNQFPRDLLVRFGARLLELSHQRELRLIVMGFSEFIEAGTPLTGDVAVWHLRLRNGAGEYRQVSRATLTAAGSNQRPMWSGSPGHLRNRRRVNPKSEIPNPKSQDCRAHSRGRWLEPTPDSPWRQWIASARPPSQIHNPKSPTVRLVAPSGTSALSPALRPRTPRPSRCRAIRSRFGSPSSASS